MLEDKLEDNLKILKHEFKSKSGRYDFLCVNKDGFLIIIEVKVGEDKYQLYQTLKYYTEIIKNKHMISSMYPDQKIDIDKTPKMILIAKSFPKELIGMSSLINAQIQLLEYKTLLTHEKEIGIIYNEKEIPILDYSLSKSITIDDHINHVKIGDLRDILSDLVNKIKNIESIDVYPTTSSIVFKHMPSNRVVCFINPRERVIQVFARIINEDGRVDKIDEKEWVYIEKGDEDLTIIFDRISENIRIFSKR